MGSLNNINASFNAEGEIITSAADGQPGTIQASPDGYVLAVDSGELFKMALSSPAVPTLYSPTITGSVVPGTATYSTQDGIYLVIGNLALVWGNISFSAFTGSGDLQIVLPSAIGTTSQGAVIGPVSFDAVYTSGNQAVVTGSTSNSFLNITCFGSGFAATVQESVSSANITFFVFYTLD